MLDIQTVIWLIFYVHVCVVGGWLLSYFFSSKHSKFSSLVMPNPFRKHCYRNNVHMLVLREHSSKTQPVLSQIIFKLYILILKFYINMFWHMQPSICLWKSFNYLFFIRSLHLSILYSKQIFNLRFMYVCLQIFILSWKFPWIMVWDNEMIYSYMF